MLRKTRKGTEKDDAGRTKPTRRQMLSGLIGTIAGFTVFSTARADGHRWYDNVFNQGSSEGDSFKRRGGRSGRSPSLSDLRAGSVPLRSDEMLDRMDLAIKRYRKIVNKGGWPTASRLRFMRPGDNDEAIPAIRRQLIVFGDIPAKAAQYYVDSIQFDEWLEHGVKRFQLRHGLRVTGWLDRPTRAQLSIKVEVRLKQLVLNRRRVARLLKVSAQKRYVLVNIPGFQLEAVERHEVERRHRVIVGKPDRQTPTLSATIRGLNFFPYWHIPDSIARLDLIPRLRRDPDYLEREHISAAKGYYGGSKLDTEAFEWGKADAKKIKFRQDPGPWNALGLVRIDMPNKDIVYLHDTPLKALFNQRRRSFSAGCVRVQRVMDLVSWIVKYEPGISKPGAIKKIIDGGNPEKLREKRPKEYDIELSRPIPVQFVYVTAWVEDSGRVDFRPDIYGRDGIRRTIDEFETDPSPSASALSP